MSCKESQVSARKRTTQNIRNTNHILCRQTIPSGNNAPIQICLVSGNTVSNLHVNKPHNCERPNLHPQSCASLSPCNQVKINSIICIGCSLSSSCPRGFGFFLIVESVFGTDYWHISLNCIAIL